MSGASPKVSVILPTFNRASLLARSAGSVLAQGFDDLELIIVDDGSSEDIAGAAAALRDSRVRCVHRPNGGVAAARNTGIREARGCYLAFQDSDDEWLPDKLARQLEMVSDGGSGCMAVCNVLRVSRGGIRQHPGHAVPGPTLSREQVLRYPFAYTQSWLVPRRAVVAAGGFDESLSVWEDWDLLIRLAATLTIRLMAEPLVVSSVSHDSLTQNQERFIEAMKHILDKHMSGLGEHRGGLADLRYIQARLYAAAGRYSDARKAAGHALRQRASHWRAGALYALSFTGSTVLSRLLRKLARGG